MFTCISSLLTFVGPMLVIGIITYIEAPGVNYQTIAKILLVVTFSKMFGTILTVFVHFKSHVIG